MRRVLGSSLAVVLARSVDTPRGNPVGGPLPAGVDDEGRAPSKPAEPVQVSAAEPRRAKRGQSAAGSKSAAASKIVETLQAAGGRAPAGSVRRLGQAIGERKSTVHNALAALVASGVVERVGGELVLRSST
jgi:hypothetical protein